MDPPASVDPLTTLFLDPAGSIRPTLPTPVMAEYQGGRVYRDVSIEGRIAQHWLDIDGDGQEEFLSIGSDGFEVASFDGQAWLRELRLVFGASTAANAAVLANFMGGLGPTSTESIDSFV